MTVDCIGAANAPTSDPTAVAAARPRDWNGCNDTATTLSSSETMGVLRMALHFKKTFEERDSVDDETEVGDAHPVNGRKRTCRGTWESIVGKTGEEAVDPPAKKRTSARLVSTLNW